MTYEIYHNLPDKNGLRYPPKSKAYVTVSKTANSNAEHTLVFFKKVLLPGAGVKKTPDGYEFDHRTGCLLDDFKGHSAEGVKNFTASAEMKDLEVIIIDGGMTPENQPLDKAVNRVFKGHLRDLYDAWSLTAPVNPATGQLLPPSRQQVVHWVVDAWELVPEELCRMSWVYCGYKPKSELGGSNATEIIRYTETETEARVEKIVGSDAVIGIDDDEIAIPVDPSEFDGYGDADEDDEDDEVGDA